MKKNKIIIVEGKTDEAKLKAIFGNINIIVTNGLNINEQLLNEIKVLSANTDIIVFTDPDSAGEKIRRIINNYLGNKCFNAFIDRKLIANERKKGIAEASVGDIKKSLENILELNGNENSMTWDEYLSNNFYIKENRVKIAEKFSWNPKMTAKVLFKYINWLGLNVSGVAEILNA